MWAPRKSRVSRGKSSNTERSLLGTEAIKFAIEKCWLSEQRRKMQVGSALALLGFGPVRRRNKPVLQRQDKRAIAIAIANLQELLSLCWLESWECVIIV